MVEQPRKRGKGAACGVVSAPTAPGTPDPLCTEDSYLPPAGVPADSRFRLLHASKLLLEELERAELKIGKETALGELPLCWGSPFLLLGHVECLLGFIYLPICEFTVQ